MSHELSWVEIAGWIKAFILTGAHAAVKHHVFHCSWHQTDFILNDQNFRLPALFHLLLFCLQGQMLVAQTGYTIRASSMTCSRKSTSTFMQSNFLLQPNFLPLLHCSEHRKQLQIFPSGARRHTMAKLCLEVSCHHQSVTAFLEQHPCHWTFFGAQGQHTPMPKGKGRDRINIAVGGRLIWMRADSMIFVVIIPVPQHLPRLVKPSGTQVSILKSFIVLHQCGVP